MIMVLTMMHMMMMMMLLMTLTCMLQYSFLNMVHSRWAVSRRGRSPATARLDTNLLFFYRTRVRSLGMLVSNSLTN